VRAEAVHTCGWFLRQALRSSARRPRAIPPDDMTPAAAASPLPRSGSGHLRLWGWTFRDVPLRPFVFNSALFLLFAPLFLCISFSFSFS
jgi:hypothetical protein